MTIELPPEFPHRTRKNEHVEDPTAGVRSPAGVRPRVPYVELHAHSSYSFLDGASLPEELAVQAAELGYPALALTDHDGVYGSLEFAHAAKHFGVRPITGAEVTLADRSHVTLLVETPQGYANLCPLLTAAPPRTRPRGRRAGKHSRPRIPRSTSACSKSSTTASSASPAAHGMGSPFATRM